MAIAILTIFQLKEEQYQEVETSLCLPWMTKELFYDYLNNCKSVGEAQALRQLSTWIATHLPQ